MRGRSEILTLTCSKCGGEVPNRVQRRPRVICYPCQVKDRKARNKARYHLKKK